MFSITEQVFVEESGLKTFLYHLYGFVGNFICMPGYFWAVGVGQGAPSGFRGDFASNVHHRRRTVGAVKYATHILYYAG